MPWLALGAAAGIVGGIGSFFANQTANDRAAALQDKNLQQWLQINIPDPKDQKLALQQFVQTGTLNPKLESAIKADPSAFTKIVTDSKYKEAQNQALGQLQDMGQSGGLRLQDRAALQDAQQSSIDQERGDRMAISQQMANRGMGGSGFGAAAQLEAQQSAADRNARSSLSTAASAQDRALQAIMGSAQMATQYQNQDFNQQAQKASAADKINMFNTQNMQDVQQRNVGSQNAAMAANLAQQQNISNQNTNLSNQQQQYNSQLLQQQFDNQTKRAAGMGGQYQAQANTALQQGQNLGNMFSNVGGAAANAFAVQANQDYQTQQQNKQSKANIDLLNSYFQKQKNQSSNDSYDYPGSSYA